MRPLSWWHVVVIEDDPMVAKAIEMSLDEIGVHVRIFHSGENALAELTSMDADFYISDFNLPGMNGIELLAEIQSRSDAPINAVLMTGEAFPGRVVLESTSGWPVLFKPVEMGRLLLAMQAVRENANRAVS